MAETFHNFQEIFGIMNDGHFATAKILLEQANLPKNICITFFPIGCDKFLTNSLDK